MDNAVAFPIEYQINARSAGHVMPMTSFSVKPSSYYRNNAELEPQPRPRRIMGIDESKVLIDGSTCGMMRSDNRYQIQR